MPEIELKPCPFCGLPLKIVNIPWSNGLDGFELWHTNDQKATDRKFTMVMGCYDTMEEAVTACNTRYSE